MFERNNNTGAGPSRDGQSNPLNAGTGIGNFLWGRLKKTLTGKEDPNAEMARLTEAVADHHKRQEKLQEKLDHLALRESQAVEKFQNAKTPAQKRQIAKEFKRIQQSCTFTERSLDRAAKEMTLLERQLELLTEGGEPVRVPKPIEIARGQKKLDRRDQDLDAALQDLDESLDAYGAEAPDAGLDEALAELEERTSSLSEAQLPGLKTPGKGAREQAFSSPQPPAPKALSQKRQQPLTNSNEIPLKE
jgi:hypothetical protein